MRTRFASLTATFAFVLALAACVMAGVALLGQQAQPTTVELAAKKKAKKKVRRGPKGVRGPAGAQGLAGAPGARGLDGVAGTPGANGANGVNGVDGANGADGANGVDGADGAEGPVGPSTGAAGGALTGSYPNPLLADLAVSTPQKLEANVVTNPKLADNAVTTAELATDAVRTADILNGAVGAEQMGSVPAAKVDGIGINTGNDVPDGTRRSLVFKAAQIAEGGAFGSNIGGDGGPRRIQMNRAGVYQVTAGVAWPHDPDGGRKIEIRQDGFSDPCLANAQLVARAEQRANSDPGKFTIQNVTGLARVTSSLDANFCVFVEHNAGADLRPNDESGTFLAAHWIGPP